MPPAMACRRYATITIRSKSKSMSKSNCYRVPTARLYLCGSLDRHDHIWSLRSLLWSYLPTDICCLRQLFIIPHIVVNLCIASFSYWP